MKQTLFKDVWQLSKAIRMEIGAVFAPKSPDDISVVEGMFLVVLESRKEQHLGARELQDIFVLSKATVSELLSSLEKKGYITVTPSLTDKRRKDIALTEKALVYVDKAIDIFAEMESHFVEGVDANDLKVFHRVVKQMERNVLGEKHR